MSICSNPKERRVRVPVGDQAVILILRDYSPSEYARFMGGRYGFKRKGKISDQSMQARIGFIDDLMVGIDAEDANGKKTHVTYVEPKSGQEKKLTPEVPDWRQFVNPSWKIAAALELEGETAEIENETLKN